MIGVIAQAPFHDVAREFFELFKTPWEFCRIGRRYNVVVCVGNECPDVDANLLLIYSNRSIRFDEAHNVPTHELKGETVVRWEGREFPLFRGALAFADDPSFPITAARSANALGCTKVLGDVPIVRIGYDLLEELRCLLVLGQPARFAKVPTLEFHIAVLRSIIVSRGLPLVEIPPVPAGHDFAVCLTHDVDHPTIHPHRIDHTIAGFLFRATVGSAYGFLRRRITARTLLRNWTAAAALPLVHLGLARDPWDTFARYMELEKGLGATYFIIPRKQSPGRTSDGPAPSARGAAYEPVDIAPKLVALSQSGSEIGLHGLDAWNDSQDAENERAIVSRHVPAPVDGVRMHWLYFDEASPAILDRAGFAYDSTVGYNETVGFRAGTLQVFRPLNSRALLELPLHVMDTALFYPSYLNLTFPRATDTCDHIFDQACQFGGVVTINWHDRSIAPERCWDAFYTTLISRLKTFGPWFATARQITVWFRQRRSASIAITESSPGSMTLRVTHESYADVRALRVRLYNLRLANTAAPASAFIDVELQAQTELVVSPMRHESPALPICPVAARFATRTDR